MSRVLDRADYFSSQVVRVRRFYDADWRARERGSLWTCLVGGGCEWCAPDYEIARQSFPFLEFGFVARGRGSVELAGRRFDVEGGTAFFFDQRTPHVMRSHPTDPMVKYFFNFVGMRGRRLVESSGLAFGGVVLVADAPRMTELLEEIIEIGRAHV